MVGGRANLGCAKAVFLLGLFWGLGTAPLLPTDCNGNGADDLADITGGGSTDCNSDGVPDECQGLPIEFETITGISLGGASRAVALGDLDGDGVVDAAVGVQRAADSEEPTGRVLLLFAEPDGRYTATDLAVGLDAGALCLFDGDGDGDLDVAVVDLGTMRFLENSGDREFFLHDSVEYVTSRTVSLTATDLEDDGSDELVVARASTDEVLVLAFAPGNVAELSVRVVGQSPRDVVVLDFDRDGALDIATANLVSNDVSILLGDGTGRFVGEVHGTPVGARPERLVAFDFDNDGWTDVATAGRDGVTILRNREGVFEEAQFFSIPRFLPRGLAAGDLNNDGYADLVAGRPVDDSVFVFRNAGGRLAAAESLLSLAPVHALELVDLDNDGDLELAVLPLRLGTLNLVWRKESRGIPLTSLAETATIPLGFQPHSGATGDINGDGNLDIIAVDGDSGVRLIPGDGRGGLGPSRSVASGNTGGLFSVVAIDFEGDGDLDVAAVSDSGNSLDTFINEGDVGFRTDATHRVGGAPILLVSADTQGDGFAELISVEASSGTLSVLVNRRDGTFEEAFAIRVGGEPRAVTSGDFDGDGDVDLAVAISRTEALVVLENDGSGAFPTRFGYPVARPRFVVALDSDLDGDVDLTTANRTPNRLIRFENTGEGRFAEVQDIALGNLPHSALTADVNGDGLPDVIIASPENDAVSMALNQPDGRFASTFAFDVGADPRFAVAGAFDESAAETVVSLNHTSEDLTVIGDPRPAGPRYREVVCTGEDFYALSVPAPRSVLVDRLAKYLAPVAAGDPDLLPVVFQNVRQYALHEEFLAAVFPDRFPVELYDSFVNRRATRQYFSGTVQLLETATGPVYGFNVVGSFLADPSELPTLDEVRSLHDQLAAVFLLRPFGYFPDTRQLRKTAEAWTDPGFLIVFEEDRPTASYEAYTTAETYGRVRVLSAEEFAIVSRAGRLTFQDILILDEAPRDIEGVVGGVVTAQRQGALSHIALRLARRGTPNAFLAEALEVFAPLDGRLVRLLVRADSYEVEEATEEKAVRFWAENRPRLATPPAIDADYRGVDSFAEMVLGTETAPQSRYGGKATNLARLQPLLGPFLQGRYVEPGLAIPLSYYLDFLAENTMASSLGAGEELSYAEHLRRLLETPRFRSDSAYRFEMLKAFRAEMRANGRVDPALIDSLAKRLPEVFSSALTMVRFRSSSNVEDRLEFNGAGLYESTSACLADTFDDDKEGPSHCDAAQPSERSLERALKKVWASLWTFRAHEEREFFGVPQELAAMGVLVTRRFEGELANGVALTGNPSVRSDRRYVVSAQVGEASVVSADPGVIAEKSFLTVHEDGSVEIERSVASSLVPRGVEVLGISHLEELGRLLRHIDDSFPVELGTRERAEVLLDIEFKIEPTGELAVKQVRPFLIADDGPDVVPPAPTFRLRVDEEPDGCGAFVFGREPVEEYRQKSQVRFFPGVFDLPTDQPSFELDLVAELRVGPEQVSLAAEGPGTFGVVRVPRDETTIYRFRYEQTFRLPDGEAYLLELEGLTFEAQGEKSVDGAERLLHGTALEEEFALRARLLDDALAPPIIYTSCALQRLPVWHVEVILEDGAVFELEERHEPPDANSTGPASLTNAVIRIGGAERVVTSYWDLVYSSRRHNRGVRYWVELEPPVVVPAANAAVRIVEIVAPEPFTGTEASVRLLDDDFAVLRTEPVMSYRRELATDFAKTPRFRRGDFNGDGDADVLDAVALLGHLFRREDAPACPRAGDTDDDGRLSVADPIRLLDAIFRRGVLPAPAGACGTDSTPDELTCNSQAACE